jgi:hypothetical protein
MNNPPLHSHTHCQVAQAEAQAKTWQRVWLSNRTTNRQTDEQKEALGGNMGLASCGVKCLNSSAVFQINFSAGLTVLCPEIPHERQAQKR